MFFKVKTAVLITAAALLLFAGIDLGYAAWWEFGALPVPGKTEKIKEEKRLVGGTEYTFIFYLSSLDTATLKDFYRTKLTAQGWQERNLLADLENLKAKALVRPDAFNKIMEQNLIFSKEDKKIVVNFLPEGVAMVQDKRTKFSVCVGSGSIPKEGQKSSVPELLSKPKREVAPVYPDARLVNATEDERASRLAYFSKDNAEKIARFYKDKMPALGWSLVEERPIEEVNNNAAAPKKDCPSCAQKTPMPMKIIIHKLTFMNAKRDTCNIVLTKIVLPENFAAVAKGVEDLAKGLGETMNELNAKLDYTNIMVDYEKAKK
jgi:hypothetical protein